MPNPPEILATRAARDSRFLRVEEVDLAFSNGARRTFERLTASGMGAVFIVPMRDQDTVLLVREYGAGVARYELGVPKGRIDRGETALHWAAFHGNAKSVTDLLQHGGDTSVRDVAFDATPLGWAKYGADNSWLRERGDYPAVMSALDAAGAT